MTDRELSDDARALVSRARAAHDPKSGASDRVRAGVEAALAGAPVVPPPRSSTPWVWGATGIVGVSLVAGLGFLALHRSPTMLGTSEPPLELDSRSASPPLPEPIATLAPSSAPSAAPLRSPVSAAPHASAAREPEPSPGGVAVEAALLRKAEASLRAGDPTGALAIVAQHARRFPSGVLGEERDMERIVALCALGRRDEAVRAREGFARAWPGSSHEARIREACDNGGAP